jgi:hypothetical protein
MPGEWRVSLSYDGTEIGWDWSDAWIVKADPKAIGDLVKQGTDDVRAMRLRATKKTRK